jgi:DNA polymerase III epsilon subunit-like protein
LAYIVYEGDREVKRFSSLVKNNHMISNSHIHGITSQDCDTKGRGLEEILEEFYKDLQTVDVVVAHNINFDKHVLLSEIYRSKLDHIADEFSEKRQVCTMKIGKDVFGLLKYPKLVELYRLCTGTSFIQQHRALLDCEACAACYFSF